MKRFFLTLCALCATTALWADTWTDPETGIAWSYIVSNDVAVISSGDDWITAIPESTSGSITIPSTLGGYPVTSIGEYAFYDCKSLTSVTIPDGVTSIGDSAFSDCTSLTSITIPSSVTSIEYDAFYYCSSLKDVRISDIAAWCAIDFDDSLSNPLYCAENLYLNGELVTDLVIPESVTSIGNYAFHNCSGLTSVTIPSSVTSIGWDAFSGCSGLTSITIPEGVTSIGVWAFSGVAPTILTAVKFPGDDMSKDNLTTVIIPDGTTSIPDSAFSGCSGLTSVTIPESVTSIETNAFYDCPNLERVVFFGKPPAESLTADRFSAIDTIRFFYHEDYDAEWKETGLLESRDFVCFNREVDGMLYHIYEGTATLVGTCAPLPEKVVVPERIATRYRVTAIGDRAFICQTQIVSLELPQTIQSIGADIISDCLNFDRVIFLGTSPTIAGNAFPAAHGYYWAEQAESWTAKIGGSTGSWKKLSVAPFDVYEDGLLYAQEDDGCVVLGSSTSCTGMLHIPEVIDGKSVTTLAPVAFLNESEITGVILPKSLTTVGSRAFEGCPKITQVALPIVNTKLSTIFPDSYRAIQALEILGEPTIIPGNYAAGCTALQTVIIPSSVTSIRNNAFSGSAPTTLTAAWVPSGMSKNNLTTVTIPEGTTSIPNSAFSNCSSLISVTIPEGVISIGSSAFSGCSGLTSITIPASMTSISSDVFGNCSGLTSVTISEGVTSIGSSAFSGCSALTSVTIPSSVTSISSNAFSNCLGLNEVHISDLLSWYAIGFSSSDSNPLYYAKNLYLNGELITDLIIPEGVTSISDYAFYGCSSLTSVTIPEGVTSIGKGAFYGCTGFTGLSLPLTLKTVGSNAFSGCTSITGSIMIAANASVGSNAFSGVAPTEVTAVGLLGNMSGSNIEKITVPAGVTQLAANAFSGCTKATEVVLPASLTTVGSDAFANVAPTTLTAPFIPGSMVRTAITSLTISTDSQALPTGAFKDCPLLETVQIPEGVTTIGIEAFENCSKLTALTLPESLKTIEEEAFYGCAALKQLTIPAAVSLIKSWAFAKCHEEIQVYFNGRPPEKVVTEEKPSLFSWSDYSTGYYRSEFADEWAAVIEYDFWDNLWMEPFSGGGDGPDAEEEDMTYTVSADNTVTITRLQNKDLTTVVIPLKIDGKTVTAIAAEAFKDCTNLTSVTIPSTVTSIGEDAFAGCTNLHTDAYGVRYESEACVVLVAAPTTLADGFVIPESVRFIHSDAFAGCMLVKTLTIPVSVRSIGDDAFAGCTGLTEVAFNGAPPKVSAPAFPAVAGTYTVACRESWEAVITNGSWANLQMKLIGLTCPVTVTIAGNGTVSGAGDYEVGATVTLTAHPASGYTFCGWSDAPKGTPATYTFTMPAEAVSVTAYFISSEWIEVYLESNELVSADEVDKKVQDYLDENNLKTEAEVAEAIEQHITENNLKTEAEVAEAIEQHITENNLKTEAEVADAIEQHVAEHGLLTPEAADQKRDDYITEHKLMSKDDAKQELLDADEVFTADEMKEMAFEAPVVEVGADAIEISISLQTADSLDAWEAMALQGATLEVDQEAGKVRVRVPKGDKKAAFYKFVVPTDQSK